MIWSIPTMWHFLELLYPRHTKYVMGVYSFCLFCVSVCQSVSLSVNIYFVSKISQELLYLETWNFVHMTSMTSCIVGKKIWAMGPGPLELFPFVVLAILMAMAGGISEHMLTSWSSFWCFCQWRAISRLPKSRTYASTDMSFVQAYGHGDRSLLTK